MENMATSTSSSFERVSAFLAERNSKVANQFNAVAEEPTAKVDISDAKAPEAKSPTAWGWGWPL
ncbi:hypothetical protein [Microbulbifer sp. A4B17]|uniref:hypothetical protein n=1 Tax=Microbulbifer sp. A4B17 TaxID=359370 RepID=UPI001300BCBD|nr:hypothetical protein [Microbulbifer sp. A4B17]